MDLSLLHGVIDWLSTMPLGDTLSAWSQYLPLELAQLKQPDFPGMVANAWDNFVKTGQVWAFLIGIVFGYLVKTFTTFG